MCLIALSIAKVLKIFHDEMLVNELLFFNNYLTVTKS